MSRLAALVVVLGAVFLLSAPSVEAQLPGDDEVCYYVADQNNDLYRVVRSTGDVLQIGDTNANGDIETLEFQPGTNILYAIDGNDLGTLNLETGAYTRITPGNFGNHSGFRPGSGADGGFSNDETIADVDSMAFDPESGFLYGAEREGGGNEPDLLVRINPATGQIVDNAFDTDGNPATNEDFVEIRTDTIPGNPRFDIDDFAMVRNNGVRLFGVANTGGDNDRLVQIKFRNGFDPTFPGDSQANPLPAGSVVDVAAFSVNDLEGLSSDRFGNFFGTSGIGSGTLYDLDPNTGVASNPRVLEGGDVEGVACFLTPTGLSLTKEVDNPCPDPGDRINYSVTLTNEGPALSSGTIVRDLLPAGLEFRDVDFIGFDPNPRDSYDENTGDWQVGVLPLGESVTMVIEVEVENGTAQQSILNTAEVFFTDQADPNSVPNDNVPTEDDQETVGISVSPEADLSVLKTDGQDSYTSGETLNYTITISNAGPTDVFQAQVADAFPAGFDSIEWTCEGPAGTTCTAAGVGDINDLVDLPSGTSVTYTVVAVVGETTTVSALVNTATVTAPTGCALNDPNNANDSATDSNELAPAMFWRPDNDSVVQAGATVTYTHQLDVVPGAGQGSLDFNIVSNQGLVWVLYEDSNGNGVFDAADQAWVNGTTPNFTTQTFFARAQVPAGVAPGFVDVTDIQAQYTIGARQFTQTVTDITRVVDETGGSLAATKEQAVDNNCDGTADTPFGLRTNINAGECAIYRLNFTNTGTAGLSQVVVRDVIPNFTTYVGGSAAYELPAPANLTPGTITEPAPGGTGPLAWPYTGTLLPGEGGSVVFSVRVQP